MPVDEKPTAGWALALSGGGLRATLFHIGVLRRLRETGDLKNVRAIFSVSGGSILAAHVRLNWNRYTGSPEEFEAAAKEIDAIASHDIRGRVVRRSMFCWLLLLPLWFRLIGRIPGLDRFAQQARHMAPVDFLIREYDRFYKQACLPRPTPGTPVLHILATSLNSGAVAAFEDDRFRVRGSGVDPVPAQRTPIALAVAASSAYPALFGPVRIDSESLVLYNGKFDGQHDLSDGGLYDNLGIEEACEIEVQTGVDFEKIIVSDAGAAMTSASGGSPWSVVRRAIRTADILMARMGHSSMKKIETRSRVKPVSIHDLVPKSATSENSQSSIGAVRTDLDVFTKRERAMIQQHGYELAGFKVYGKTPDAPDGNIPPLAGSQKSSILGLFQWRDWTSWANATLAASWLKVILYALAYSQLTRDYHKHQVAEYLRLGEVAARLATADIDDDPTAWKTKSAALIPIEYWNAASYSDYSIASQFPPLRWLAKLHGMAADALNIHQPFPPLLDHDLRKSSDCLAAAQGHQRYGQVKAFMHTIGNRWAKELPNDFVAARDNLYLQVTRLAERITESPNLKPSERDEFFAFYWGKLLPVESRAEGSQTFSVESEMVEFGRQVNNWHFAKEKPAALDKARDNLVRSLVREQKTQPATSTVIHDNCPAP